MSSYQPRGIKKIFHASRRSLAKWWLSLMNPVQIAVTGSQGKTNTTHTIAKLLSQTGNTVSTDLNLDTTYNVPITALHVKPWTRYLVWELGVDHSYEMRKHLEIANPTIAVITGISPVHTDDEHFGSLENLIREKRSLIEALPPTGTSILNGDDHHVRSMAPFTKASVLFYGTNKKKCDVWAENIAVSLNGTTFELFDRTNSSWSLKVKTPFIGTHHAYTLMAAFLAARSAMKEKPSEISRLFLKTAASLHPLRGRMSVEPGPLETVLLNDSLRANPESTKTGLETLHKIPYSKGKKIAVLGVMGELESPKEEHEETGKQLIQFPPDLVVCLGDWRRYTYSSAVRSGFPKTNIIWVKNVFEAAEFLKSRLKKNDLFYLKGSFLRNLKRIVQLLNGETVCCDAEFCPYEHCGYTS